MNEPIAIIGSGCRFPGGANTPAKLWSLVQSPRDLSKKPPADRFNIEAFYNPVGTHSGTTDADKSYWLEEDVSHFDASFFNIQAAEAEAMDPQQRLLLEAVYDGLCSAGQPIESLRGSDTAVYVGQMCDDYNTMLTKDWLTLPRYAATGLERAIVANRISYFFDWHGPSLSVDTACSSSLVALDQAVQILRSGKSKMAIAAGTNLILSPAMYVSESNLGMLSPSGRCAMWDEKADGYTRGEGVAAVLLKTLSQALADNDPIECVIRETAVNQDGHAAPGLTVPSNVAQTALIRECYARAGLDPINNVDDRPQFFHAHGTGTQAGDPQEAEAISRALFPVGTEADVPKVLVGSIKTVIGHTEGTAGVTSVIATSLALKHGVVPPNMHFQTLNPKIVEFYANLEIPTTARPWPNLVDGQARRASVNSFGFGGTNAHCIMEQYNPESDSQLDNLSHNCVLYTPLVFSAASESSLRAMLSAHLDYLKSHPDVNLGDFAYTLQHRRSTLAYRAAVSAPSIELGIRSLEDLIASDSNLGTRFSTKNTKAKILGIFTGQGAQWPRMGARLIKSSPFAARRVDELDAILQNIPNKSERPLWTLKEQLLAGQDTSRVSEAALSQPLCTVVQILLVDLLRAAGITFDAVVGHSSGEIGAAYAAELISARDAVLIAYFRGLHAKLAASPNSQACRGAMMAVGTSLEEATSFCEEKFAGRLQVAAVNSPSSVTISGDEDAADEAEGIFKLQGTFARRLKVDTAYHSAHMAPCAAPYLASLEGSGVAALGEHSGRCANPRTVWYSSVHEGRAMQTKDLVNQYWVDNMCNPVLFADAVSNAAEYGGPFDLAVEVGPHPALKGPAMATLDAGPELSYTGLLSRGKDDVETLSAALGYIWTRLGANSLQFSAVQTLLSGNTEQWQTNSQWNVIPNLPSYPFDHQRSFWHDSRVANTYKQRGPTEIPNPILGTPCLEASTPREFQWRNFLRPSEMPWLRGHVLQGQMVFPATGYVCMAVEATKSLAYILATNYGLPEDPVDVSVLRLTNVYIPSAIAFNDDDANIETIFTMSVVSKGEDFINADWACYSVPEGNGQKIVLNAKGKVHAELSQLQPDALPMFRAATDPSNLVRVAEDEFYGNLSGIGYDYAPPFRGLSNIARKPGHSVGSLDDQSGCEWYDNLVLHPGLLDSALQTVFAAWSHPGDGQIWSLHVPVSVDAITINLFYSSLGNDCEQSTMSFETKIRSKAPTAVVGDIYLHTEHSGQTHCFIQFEGAALVPFSRATPKDDLPMFSHFQYGVSKPDAELAAAGDGLSAHEVQLYKDVDRISYWYARNAALAIPAQERHSLLPHYRHYLAWCDRMVGKIGSGEYGKVPPSCDNDTREDIDALLEKYPTRKDVRFVQVVGDHLVDTIREGRSMLEHMNRDGLLLAFYEEGAICSGPTGRWLARLLGQISHRFPDAHILEVGAGTGATTEAVLRAIDQGYASYTFTDVSSGFFLPAEERFGERASRMVFKTFDMEKDPIGQGFEEGSYDIVVAVNVLHVSRDMEASLTNVRKLLKPGGFLVVAELTSTDLLFSGMTVGTLPGWWIGVDTGRLWGPLLTLPQWDETLRKVGFGSIDTVTPDISASLPMSVFVAQALDDKITLLREPLTVAKHPPGIQMDALAIIGGYTEPVNELVSQVFEIVGPRFQHKQTFTTVEEFASSSLTHSARSGLGAGPVTILCVTDLDEPYLESLTHSKFEALKTLWNTAGTVIWTTCGSRDVQPFSYMMTGVARTVATEYPNLSMQMVDLDATEGIASDTASILVEALLRQLALHSWGAKTGTDGFMWTLEPELYVENGRQLLTRIRPDHGKNMRYNSRIRDVVKCVDATFEETIRLVGDRADDGGLGLELQDVSPLELRRGVMPLGPGAKHRTVKITHSLLQSVAVSSGGFFRLCAGVDVETDERVLAMADSDSSPAVIPISLCIPISETPPPSVLVSLAANLIAEQILALAPSGSTILLHEADVEVRQAIWGKAHRNHVRAVFSSAQFGRSLERGRDLGAPEHNGPEPVRLDPHCPQHLMREAIPAATAVFVHFSRGAGSEAVRHAISTFLPAHCLSISEEALLSGKVGRVGNNTSPDVHAAVLTEVVREFRNAWRDASVTCGSSSSSPLSSNRKDNPVLTLGDAVQHTAVGESLSVVDWHAQEVYVKVQPLDSGVLFREDRTYVFVGMAGELGQSLTGWMMAHGARHVVLASRKPKVNPEFVTDMKTKYHGSVVRAMSVDVTSLESLSHMRDTVVATLPPIGGIVNGAMILDDELFNDMSYEQFEKVTRPKVLGTSLLDQLFHDDRSLEFFIVATSIASVIGWTGQSNYSAANEFMTSLVSNRRNRRGVVGSAMSIPAVKGIGYAAREENGFDFSYFASLGYINISEEDLHTLFAEAILNGRPEQKFRSSTQVVMGVNYIPADLEVKAVHRRDVKFSHFIRHEDATSGAAKLVGKPAGVHVKVQLETARSFEEACAIVSSGFLAQLKRILRLSEDSNLDESATLVELGIDSLVAVDVRSWFRREVSVDLPTLRILSGGSISDLLDTAVEKWAHQMLSQAVMEETSPGYQHQQLPHHPKSSSPLNKFNLSKSVAFDSPLEGTPRSEVSPVFTPPGSDDDSGSTSTPPTSEREAGAKLGNGNSMTAEKASNVL